MQEANLSIQKSESDSDDSNDSGWSEHYGNQSDLCERMVTPRESLATHNSAVDSEDMNRDGEEEEECGEGLTSWR